MECRYFEIELLQKSLAKNLFGFIDADLLIRKQHCNVVGLSAHDALVSISSMCKLFNRLKVTIEALHFHENFVMPRPQFA